MKLISGLVRCVQPCFGRERCLRCEGEACTADGGDDSESETVARRNLFSAH